MRTAWVFAVGFLACWLWFLLGGPWAATAWATGLIVAPSIYLRRWPWRL